MHKHTAGLRSSSFFTYHALLGCLVLGSAACGGDSGGPPDGPDPIAIVIDSIVPANNAVDQELATALRIYFDGPADPSTVTSETVTLTSAGTPLPATVTYEAGTNSARLAGPLLPSSSYTLTASSAIRSATHGQLVAPGSAAFTTRDPRVALVDSPADGYKPTIVVTPSGMTYVLYRDGTTRLASCAANCGQAASWQTSLIDTVSASYPANLVVDPAGGLHAVYSELNHSRLYYGYCAASCGTQASWVATLVDGSVATVTEARLAIDGSGVLHLLYDSQGGSDIRYATCTASCTVPGNWTLGVAQSTSAAGGTSSLTVADGRLHATYYDIDLDRLQYATCTTGCLTPAGWTRTSIDAAGSFGSYAALQRSPEGTLYVGYATSPYAVVVASCASGCTTAANWTRTQVDTDLSSSGAEVGLTLASDGRLGIVYLNVSTADLRYATCAADCTTPASWRTTTLDEVGSVGFSPASVLDANGGLRVAYIGSGLKYAE